MTNSVIGTVAVAAGTGLLLPWPWSFRKPTMPRRPRLGLPILAFAALLSAVPAASAQGPASTAEAEIFRGRVDELFMGGNRDGAIALMREVVGFDRTSGAPGAVLANDLLGLSGMLDAPDDDNLWEDSEDLRLEAIEILSALPEAVELHRDAVGELAMHYIRREYGRDFADQALAYFDLIEGVPDADARAGYLVEDACSRADFASYPKLSVDFASVAEAYLDRFAAGDDDAVICAADNLRRLLDIGRELEDLDRHSGEIVRIVAGSGTIGPLAAYDAFDLRARVLLAAGRYDEALAAAEMAIARMNAGDAPAGFRAGSMALRAEAWFRKGDAAKAAADATEAVLGYEGAATEDTPQQALALSLLAEILSTIPDRQNAVPALLTRARELAQSAATGGTKGWEDAVRRTYTLTVSRLLAEGDPAAASAIAADLATFNSEVLSLQWRQDWADLIDFPANVALLLYQRNFDRAESQLDLVRIGLEADYFRQYNYFTSPLVRADIAEYSVLLALLKADAGDGTTLDGAALVTLLDEALQIRNDSLPATHPLIIQHYALRAVILSRIGQPEQALAAAREGLRRFVERGVSPREAGGSITSLFVDPVYQQLVIAAWLGLPALPQ
jgi:tetratricopeptide (TPR) repeat protein